MPLTPNIRLDLTERHTHLRWMFGHKIETIERNEKLEKREKAQHARQKENYLKTVNRVKGDEVKNKENLCTCRMRYEPVVQNRGNG